MIRRVLLGGALALFPAMASGQDSPVLVEYYGDGVHAYSTGDVFESHRLLTQAIDGGIQDPRAYFFRAMTLLRMGRDVEAEADMEAGAYLEARAPSGAYAVDRSIQRLQGRDRLALEKVRRRVRFQVEQERRAEMAERYEQTQRNEAAVLRIEPRPTYDEAVQPAAASEAPTSQGSPTAPVTEETPAVESFSPDEGDVPPAIEQPATGPPPVVEPAANDADNGAGDDPFSPGNPFDETPDAAGAANTPDTNVEVGQEVEGSKILGILGSIFGDAVESAGDAVASALPQPPMGVGMPFDAGAAPPAGEPFGADDPFGGIATPADAAPPAQANDPFGGENPFGGLNQGPANETPPAADAATPAEDNDAADNDDGDASIDESDPFGAAADPFNGSSG